MNAVRESIADMNFIKNWWNKQRDKEIERQITIATTRINIAFDDMKRLVSEFQTMYPTVDTNTLERIVLVSYTNGMSYATKNHEQKKKML